MHKKKELERRARRQQYLDQTALTVSMRRMNEEREDSLLIPSEFFSIFQQLKATAPESDTLHNTCLHEASHAVIGELRGLHVVRCFVIDRSKLTAVTEFRDKTVSGAEQEMAYLMQLVAGPACDHKLGLYPVDKYIGSDLSTAVRFLYKLRFPPEDFVRAFTNLESRVARMLEMPDVWQTVEVIAARMENDGSIEGEAIRQVIEQHQISCSSIEPVPSSERAT